MKLLGISGSLSDNSKTELTVSAALRYAGERDRSVETDLLALSHYSLNFCDGRHPDDYTGDTRKVIDKVTASDAVIVGSPIYRGSYTGSLKNLFDLIPNDALKGKAVGIVATGGSAHHFLAIEHQFRPIFSYFNAYTVPSGVYVSNEHFQDGELTAPEIHTRLKYLASDTVRLANLLAGNAGGPGLPVIKRESLKAS